MENSSAVPQTVEYRITIWPCNSTLKYTAKKYENICPHRILPVNIYNNIIHNSVDGAGVGWGVTT